MTYMHVTHKSARMKAGKQGGTAEHFVPMPIWHGDFFCFIGTTMLL